MKKNYQTGAARAAMSEIVVPDAMSVAMSELTAAMREGLLALAVGAGLQVMQTLMDESVTAICGPKGAHDPDRTAVRHGREDGSVVLGGRQVPVRRPRVRTADKTTEVAVPVYELFTSTELLGELALERMMAKLSTRRYHAGLEPVGAAVEASARSTSRSAVSRRFVAMTDRALDEMMHEPLVTREQFDAAQSMFAANKRRVARQPGEGRHYLLSGLVHCGVCGCRMQGQWNHGRAYYRCKYSSDYPDRAGDHPKSVYVKEAAVLPGLDGWLATLFDDEHIDATGEMLAGASEAEPDTERREADLRAAIKECDQKIERYRKLLDQGGDVAIAANWITEVRRERRALESQLGYEVPGGKMTKEQVKALVTALRDIVEVLADADPADKRDLYNELGVTLTYNPNGTVAVKAHPRGVNVRVGGGT